jgi:hypothetical protein
MTGTGTERRSEFESLRATVRCRSPNDEMPDSNEEMQKKTGKSHI